MSARIDRILPTPTDDLDDEEILRTYALPEVVAPGDPWVSMNFISSIDGAVTRDGRSGGLGDEADRRVFALLRRPADVVLVGAGTIRAEEYGAFRLDEADARWRVAQGMPPHPVLAIVSGALDLDPEHELFTDAAVRPIVYTVSAAPADRRAALQEVADVLDAGDSTLDPRAVRDDLIARGLPRIHSEGGPHLFGSFIEAGAVDELCLTLAPSLQAGDAGRIAASATSAPQDMELAALLRAGDELFLRYTAVRAKSRPEG